MTKYFFRNDHNGYEVTYTPFEVCGNLSQKQAEELILEIAPAARRCGSCIEHLLEALDKRNIVFKQYKSVYHKPEDNDLRLSIGNPQTDPLPDCMYSWPIIEGISGNY